MNIREGFKKKKKIDNYHFWGEGGSARVIYHFFFGLKMVFSAFLGAKKHFFQKVLKNGLVLKK